MQKPSIIKTEGFFIILKPDPDSIRLIFLQHSSSETFILT